MRCPTPFVERTDVAGRPAFSQRFEDVPEQLIGARVPDLWTGDARRAHYTAAMSLASVREFLAQHAPDLVILESADSTATVAAAAAVHDVAPGQIAKTLCLWVREQPILLVAAGDARLDNRKLKAQFGGRTTMLSSEEVLHWTGHPVGGVCPFGLARALPVYTDRSLAAYDEVLPAAGSANSALRITPARLVALCAAQWVDVTQQR